MLRKCIICLTSKEVPPNSFANCIHGVSGHGPVCQECRDSIQPSNGPGGGMKIRCPVCRKPIHNHPVFHPVHIAAAHGLHLPFSKITFHDHPHFIVWNFNILCGKTLGY